MPTTIVYDACVLYPAALRDLLIRIAMEGLCQARWSDDILDEVFANLRQARPDLDPAKLARTRRRMCAAVPDCLVVDYLDLVDSLDLPDHSDRHVLAAAIRAGAEVIVTDNLKDFPDLKLRPHGVVAWSADELVVRVIESAPVQVTEIVERQAADLKNPTCTVEALLQKLRGQGLIRSVALLAGYLVHESPGSS